MSNTAFIPVGASNCTTTICGHYWANSKSPPMARCAGFMASQGLHKQRRVEASRQFAPREVRSFEVEHVNSCWHLDFHTGSRSVLTAKGTWVKPSALCILDDRSRLICHVQWFLDETARTLVHGFCQALMRRALPRSLLTDNGAAMTAEEFQNGLHTLGILHQTTLPFTGPACGAAGAGAAVQGAVERPAASPRERRRCPN
jgi:putative transposase